MSETFKNYQPEDSKPEDDETVGHAAQADGTFLNSIVDKVVNQAAESDQGNILGPRPGSVQRRPSQLAESLQVDTAAASTTSHLPEQRGADALATYYGQADNPVDPTKIKKLGSLANLPEGYINTDEKPL